VPLIGVVDHGYRVGTPCDGEALLALGKPLHAATVVLDPGHGGEEIGATGPNGLRESDLNLEIAKRTADVLRSQGAVVVLTRTADYRVTLAARAMIARALHPRAFVSIHHNGMPDGPSTKPGTETYYQVASPASKRLAGLVYEEVVAVFGRHPGIAWNANVDAGAKYRKSDTGDDYYGILRRTHDEPAVLSEALFLSSSLAEAELLARPDVQQAEADALARAISRFILTDDPGSGFVEPVPRTTPAGGGGGGAGCKDPVLE
jgi:N-acetylmuramoyl-L-alanine amidase